MFVIEDELKKLPDQPGVYLMHSASDEIIYVGKAINLKNRVRQYFQSSRTRTPKIEKMVSLISYFEYIVTDSELEALILESNLIKNLSPKYNTMLKDDKSYPYIKVTIEEEYPRVLFARMMKRDKSKYFGPYTSGQSVRDTIELLRKLYRIRTCNKSLPRDIGKDRPCVYYQIKQCDAPCMGYISHDEYNQNIEKVLDFLNGNHTQIVDDLKEKMMKYSEDMEFEKAAEVRDLINSIMHVSGTQRVSGSMAVYRDVIAMDVCDNEAVVAIFFIREGKLLGREHFHMSGVASETKGAILSAFMKQYYQGTPFVPKEIVVEHVIDDAELLEQWLSQKAECKVKIVTPQKGEKHKLIELAKENAAMVMTKDLEKIKREEERTIGAANEVASLLGISNANRIEAFDISNTSGFQSVASMVVFERGKAKHSDYRKFKLRTVTGPDDYKSMEEVLTRRFTDERFDIYPDLIMMDGGRGQVNVALRVLNELNISIPVCGMVKDDNHRTRGLYFNNEEIYFPPKNQAFGLVTRVQDEAHRFAIEYHKLLRGKNQVKSILDDIPLVGPKRRKALMMQFKSIELIKAADVEEIMKTPGMNRQAAQSIYDFFQGEK